MTSGHKVGWLHDVVKTSPFCELSVSSTFEKSAVVGILETSKGISMTTELWLAAMVALLLLCYLTYALLFPEKF